MRELSKYPVGGPLPPPFTGVPAAIGTMGVPPTPAEKSVCVGWGRGVNGDR